MLSEARRNAGFSRFGKKVSREWKKETNAKIVLYFSTKK